VYDVTATFTDTVEAGPDAGSPDLFATPVSGGGPATTIRWHSATQRLYWLFGAVNVGLAFAQTFGGAVPQTPQIQVAQLDRLIGFEVDVGVLYQTASNPWNVMTATTPTLLPGSVGCTSAASDGTDVYCRTTTANVLQWTVNGAGPNVLYSGLGVSSAKLVADDSQFGSLFYVDGASIRRAPKSGADGGAPVPLTIASGRNAPTELHFGSLNGFLYWLEPDSFGNESAFSTFAFGSNEPKNVSTSTQDLFEVVPDPGNSSIAWLAIGGTSGTIQRSTTIGSAFSMTTCKTNIKGLGGITADFSYVYWTESDGSVHRFQKFDCF
jgi:hypothetical protein